ncbi:hypothetical protein ACP275_01G045300 [Erythranthe tilingii]
MAASSTNSWLFAICIAASVFVSPSFSDDKIYATSLLKFKQFLTNATMLENWKEPVVDKLCSYNKPNWTGCLCLNGSFIGLRLDGMGLGGKIDAESLSNLPVFIFSIVNNNFAGPFPSGVNKLGKLRSLYFANNSFSGEIPEDSFSGMKALRKVVMSDNSFMGNIPLSMVELPRLVDLRLQRNRFGGTIPDFSQEYLTVNFSYNDLVGPIPISLSNQDASSFVGNSNLCGKPLEPCKSKN